MLASGSDSQRFALEQKTEIGSNRFNISTRSNATQCTTTNVNQPWLELQSPRSQISFPLRTSVGASVSEADVHAIIACRSYARVIQTCSLPPLKSVSHAARFQAAIFLVLLDLYDRL